MTEYEIADLAASNLGTTLQALELAQMYSDSLIGMVELSMAILTGYLVAAHFIGPNLTRVQVGIFTTLYLVFLVLVFSGIITTTQAWILTIEQVAKSDPTLGMPENLAFKEITGLSITALGLALGAASLYFMWSVRHPKTE